MTDIVDRLNGSLSAGYSELRKEAAVTITRLRASLEAAEKERDALHAKIEQMERQEPFAWVVRGGYPVPLENLEWQLLCGAERPTLSWTNQEMRPLYALHGAQTQGEGK